MRVRKALNIILTVILSGLFLWLGYRHFSGSYIRLGESFKDLFGSLKYYFYMLFDKPIEGTPHVAEYSEFVKWEILLPKDFETFKLGAAAYFKALFNGKNFVGWLTSALTDVGGFAKVMMLILPCIVVGIIIIKRIYGQENTNHGKDTVPLRVYKFIAKKTYQPIKGFVQQYIEFIKANSWIWISWVVLWGLHFNLGAIIVGFFAYYFFFSVSFRWETLYVQFVKLVLDLQTIIRFFPWWVLAFFAYAIFHHIRKKIALAMLRNYEARNCGFINSLPIVSITCGSMGKKKTTMITDMTLSQEVMFRQKAFEIIQKGDMQFPHFPWIHFEDELLRCMEHGTVYNLATVKAWVAKKQERYEKHHNSDLQLYGYDTKRYGLVYNDALKPRHLFEVLETYGQAYFIYAMQTSLIVANYSVRTDNEMVSVGNFPMWLTDFFAEERRNSRHSHILDFDVLRLGKKVMESNPNAGSFEFGVVAITEIGKERGNNLELKEIKKKNDETNQKNDLFNSWLKMCRHSATVDNFPFIKVFTDEQRPESWGADARDLCDIVNIAQAGETKLALPFYTIEEMLSEWAYNWFISLYYDFRYRRGDNTLLVHLLKSVTSWLWKRNHRIYNRFGYSELKVEKERGTMDGRAESKKYYLMHNKIYSGRFTTDCFSDYFNDLAKKTPVGLLDYPEYETEKASIDELKMQNSYFINSLYKDEEE